MKSKTTPGFIGSAIGSLTGYVISIVATPGWALLITIVCTVLGAIAGRYLGTVKKY